jgi:hypothetical protein
MMGAPPPGCTHVLASYSRAARAAQQGRVCGPHQTAGRRQDEQAAVVGCYRACGSWGGTMGGSTPRQVPLAGTLLLAAPVLVQAGCACLAPGWMGRGRPAVQCVWGGGGK